jgi:hypothetical protein
MKLLASVALVPITLAGCLGEDLETAVATAPIVIVAGDLGCAEAGLGDRELRVEAPFAPSYAIDGSVLTVGFDADGIFFYFTSSGLRLDGVLARAGGRTGVWDFGTESNGWGSLFAPIDAATGAMLPTESISFCYDYDLLVNPNAYASYGLRHSWDITKTSADADLTLAEGQEFLASYDVTVTLASVEEAGFLIDGPVYVRNQSPVPTTLTGVTVAVGELEAAVTCPVAFPWVLAADGVLECSYTTEAPDALDRMVVVTVTTADGLAGGTGSELASFSSHTTGTQLIDECVAVTDDRVGFLGTVCADQGAATFTYLMAIGPFAACGPFAVENIARFAGLDTGAGGEASYTITGEVPCDAGCSLTPGYWKTHSEYGPARYDATWGQLTDGADTAFALSGTSYYGALWTPPAGNPYWILAHAYIAAELNLRNGASFDDAQAAFDAATTLLATWTPAQVRNGTRALRGQFTSLAGTLDAYNNGLIGPGHCDE